MCVYLVTSVAQLCPTLCDPTGCSLLGSSSHGIFQARILEWVAISSSRGFNQYVIINEIFAIPFIKIVCRMWCVF